MRWMLMLSMLVFVALSPSSCTPEQIDSYCQLYRQVVVSKGDGAIQAPLEVKKRILANETLYRQYCIKSS